MGTDRRFDEREVGLILKRVAELNEHEGGPNDSRAMTRDEIEEVVAELGISKALVARAVSEISVQDLRNQPVWTLGGKTDVMLEERLPGRIDEATHTRMLEVLRRFLGDPGDLRLEGATRIWSSSEDASRRVHFSMVDMDGETTLRLEESLALEANGAVRGTSFAGGFLGFMSLVPLKALVLKSTLLLAMGPMTALGATGGWLLGRRWWSKHSRKRESDLRRAYSEILALARQRE